MEKSEVFSPEAVMNQRSRLGVSVRRTGAPFNEVCTKDAIRHYAHGLGDTNPLWTDEEYAKKSRWGSLIGPPCFLYACGAGALVQEGLPGVHGLHAGDDRLGHVAIDGATEMMKVTLKDVGDRALWSTPLEPKLGRWSGVPAPRRI